MVRLLEISRSPTRLGIFLLIAIVSAQSPYDYDIRSEFSGDQRTRSAEVQPVEFAANGGEIVAVRSPILDPEVADQLEGNGWLDVIPGTPGKDYPNYEILPQTSFTCRGRTPGGYYADVETRCQVFHVCDADGRKNSFLCPSGSIFNQKYFICDWWYDFECDDATELYSLNDKVKRGDRASGPKVPGQGHAQDEIDVGCCAEDEEEGNVHGTFDGDLSLAGTGEGSIGYARRNNQSRGYQSNEKDAEEESRGGNESHGQGRGERKEDSFRNEESRTSNQFAANGFARGHRTAGNNDARGRKVKADATLEPKSQAPERSNDEDDIRGNFRQGQLETARESLQHREVGEYASGNDNYSDYGTHQGRRLPTSRHSSGSRDERIEHLDKVQPDFKRSRSTDNRMLDAGQDSSSSWHSSGSSEERFNDRRSLPRNRDLKNYNMRPLRGEKNTSSYGDSAGPNYDESEGTGDSKSDSSGYRRQTRPQNLADANNPGTFHQPQTRSQLGSFSSRVNQKSSFATSSRHANNAVSDRGVNSSFSSTVSHANSPHSDSFNQLSTDIGSQVNDSQRWSPDLKKYSDAEETSAQQRLTNSAKSEKRFDDIDVESPKFDDSILDHRKFAHHRVSNGRVVQESSDGRGATVVRRSSDDDDEIPHYDVAKIQDFVRRNVGAATNDREFNFTEYPKPSHPRYPSRSNEEEFFPSSVISQDSKQPEDKGASGIKRFNSTGGSPSSASGRRANVKESSHSTATGEISRRNNGQSRQRTSEGLQNGLGNGYPSAGRGRELPGSAVIVGTIAPGTVYGCSVEKSSTTTIPQARGWPFGTRTPGMITDARSSVTRIGDLDALEKSAPHPQNGDHLRSNFTNGRTSLYEQPSGTSDSPDRERKSERPSATKRANRTGRKKSSRLIGKNVQGPNSFPRSSSHEDNDYSMKLRFLPLL